MPLFGSKKKKEQRGTDIEVPEEDGLFMARNSEQTDTEAGSAPSVDEENNETEPGTLTGDDALEVSGLEGEAQETTDSKEASAEVPAAATNAEDESGADDLLAAFQDDETHGDLTDITKDLEDVPIADLLAELREIRATLPPEALENDEDVA